MVAVKRNRRKKTTSSSSSSKTSKTASSSSVKKATPPPAKPKNVDKVEFGKPKPKVDAGTYKPEPPKEDPLDALKREALSLLPRNVDLANKAFHELEDAQREESIARNAFLREKKKYEESGAIAQATYHAGVEAVKGYKIGQITAAKLPEAPGAPIFPYAAAAGGAIGGFIEGMADGKADMEAAEAVWQEAKKNADRLGSRFLEADLGLRRRLHDATKRKMEVNEFIDAFSYPTSVAELKSRFKF